MALGELAQAVDLPKATVHGLLASLRMGGAVEQLGMYKRFEYSGLSGHGFDGVMIAVIAGNNPKYVPIAALFLAYVNVGAETMARRCV